MHLLAELLENATTFSSPQTKVRVTATRLPDSRVMIEIHDKGIGLTAEDFADINHKLANPPTVDAAVSQRMGLFVVGRLSDRHGIRVQLRPSGEQAGTTSLVMLPDAITHGGGGEPPAAADDFTVSSIIPEQQGFEQQPSQPHLRTAAELGFDDSRYEQPSADSAQLDPVGRSLMRGERRAALEAQTAGEHPQFPQDPYAEGQYTDGQYTDGGFARNGYGQEPQQEQYEQAPYQGGYEPYPADAGVGGQPGQAPAGGYAEGGYAAGEAAQPSYEEQFAPRSQQDDWPDQAAYRGTYEPSAPAEAESVPSAPAEPQERVGFDRPGPTPDSGHELTEAGLPRRGGQQHWQPTGRGNSRPSPRSSSRRRRKCRSSRRPRSRTESAPTTGARPTTSAGSGPRSSGSRRRAGSPRPVSPAGAQGQSGRGHGRADLAGRPPGFPRPRGRPRQVEQPAAGRAPGTQRGFGRQ